MKKYTISNMFLYRHRFGIGYAILGLLFAAMLILLPAITPNGLSEAEMQSSVTSANLNRNTILSGNIVDLPYHMLQKVSIMLFGLTPYGIKLPSIIMGGILGILFILLLNRWFKNNVAIMASVLAVLSSSFLYIAGSGTPLIMIVFWPTLLFWIGSKIQGENKPRPFYSFIFAIILLLSIFTPYMIYLAIFIVIFALVNPHLRFTIKNLPKVPFTLMTIIVLAVGAFIVYNATKNHGTIPELLFMNDFSWGKYLANIRDAFMPFFQWNGMVENTFLAPLIGLASMALAVIGLISTYKGFFASRNSIATCLIAFTVIISGFNPICAILLILPLAILIAHGFRYTLNSWYGLFPENPYARVFGIIPIAIFLGIMITSDITHFIFGYRYNPAVANLFSNDLQLVKEHVEENTILVTSTDLEKDFYSILENKRIIGTNKQIKVTNKIDATIGATSFATLRNIEDEKNAEFFKGYKLDKIITNSKTENSDRIYIYKIIAAELEEPGV